MTISFPDYFGTSTATNVRVSRNKMRHCIAPCLRRSLACIEFAFVFSYRVVFSTSQVLVYNRLCRTCASEMAGHWRGRSQERWTMSSGMRATTHAGY